ncbi:MAG TPA: ATP-binding protein [Vicinamibacterales bacterium]|nr:ATP-binding protein [Vicinamibacterales bacterium]
MSIKARQVAGVTTLVVMIVVVLSALHMATLAGLSLAETASRGELLARSIFQRARDVVPGAPEPYGALRQDGGIRSILESSVAYSKNVTYAAIVNTDGVAVVHSFPSLQGKPMPPQEDLQAIVNAGPLAQLRAVYSDRTFEIRQPLLFGDRQFGSIVIGVSTLLVRSELQAAFNQALQTILLALIVAALVSTLLAQWMLRPIHVIQSGLTRLGRGELDVRLDLPAGEEFKDLGTSFNAVSAQLSASRTRALPSAPADFETVVENLEDAVALFGPAGDLIFRNSAMRALLPGFGAEGQRRIEHMAPPSDPARQLVERTLAAHADQGPVSIGLDDGHAAASPEAHGERLLMTHAIDAADGKFVGAMLVARNLAYMSQVHSTLNYSRKLAALGRLMAGVAHEVKNPLNAMTIHLELLKQKLAAAARQPVGVGGPVPPGTDGVAPNIVKHVDIITSEIHRLDQVVNGFLKFARPEELKLQPVRLASIVSDVATTVAPEAERAGVSVKTECPHDLPEVNADPAMLRQGLLNLALNACQAMPDGGTLRLACHTAPHHRVGIDVEDTGVGIAPGDLQRIFDLYFTTKEKGSGIGLSMVYRIVQLHDGEVEVQSTPGRGTRFRLVFPQA